MRKIVPCILFLICLTCLPLQAQETPRFDETRLQLEGMISDLRIIDINGDTRMDIAVSHSSRQFNLKTIRSISFFIRTETGYPETPDVTRTCSSGDILWDLADLDSDGIPELLLMGKDGISVCRWQQDRFTGSAEQLVEDDLLFPGSSGRAIYSAPLAKNIDEEGSPEIIIYGDHSLRIYKRQTAGYRMAYNLYTVPAYEFSSPGNLEYTFNLPHIISANFNDDDNADMLIINRDVLDLFILYPGSGLNTSNLRLPDLKYKMQGRDISPSIFAGLAPADIRLETADLNGDALIDLILSKEPNARFRTGISQVQIFLNKNGHYDIFPDQILTADNFSGDHIITDVNQDGLLDIALLTFPLGFTQAARFLLTKKTGNSYEIFLMKPDGSYDDLPDTRIGFTRAVALDNPLDDSPLRSMEHDFTGDGIADFIIETGRTEFTVFPGRDGSVFTKKNRFKINASANGNLLPADINQDGIADLILWDPSEPDGISTITIISSSQDLHK